MVPTSSIAELEAMGGRVATAQELKELAPSEPLSARLGDAAGMALAAPVAIAGGIAVPIVGSIAKGLLHHVPGVAATEQKLRDGELGAIGRLSQGYQDSTDAANLSTLNQYGAGMGTGAVRQALKLVSPEAGKSFEEWTTKTHADNPVASALGGITGLAAGMVSATGPVGLIGKAGRAAEGLAATATAGLGEGSAIARALGAGARMAAGGATEGALFSAADQIGEHMLGDHELAAEKLAAAIGHGALVGGALGGALGAGGSLAKSGLVAAADATRGGISRVLSGGEGSFAARSTKTMAEKADELAFRSLGGGQKAVRAAEEFPGGVNGVGDVLHKYKIVDVAPETEGAMSAAWNAGKVGRADEILPRISAAKNEIGAKLGALTDSAEKVDLASVYKDIGAIRSKLQEKIVGRKSTAAFDEAWDLVHGVLSDSGAITGEGVAAKNLFDVRKQLDDLVFQSRGQTISEAQKAVVQLRNTIEQHALNAVEKEAGAAGAAKKADILNLKRDYRALSIAEEAAEKGAERIAGNNQLSVRDLMGAASLVAGGHAVAAPIAAVAGKMVRERGEAAAAVLLKRLSSIQAIQDAIQQADTTITGAAKGLLDPKPIKTVLQRAPATPIKALAKSAVKEANSRDPYRVAEDVSSHTEQMAATAPKTAGHVSVVASRSAAWLASQTPNTTSNDPLNPRREAPMSDADAARFVRKYQAAQNPMGVLKDMQRGYVDRDAVEALKQTSPKMFAQLQMATLDELASNIAAGKKIAYEARLRLALVLDAPTDASLRPDTIKMLQANVAAQQQNQPPPAKLPGAKALNINLIPSSKLDRIESGAKGKR